MTENTLNVLLLAHGLAPQFGPQTFETANKAPEALNTLRAKRGAAALDTD